MSRWGALTDVRDLVLRMLPHAVRPGLRAVGCPGRDAPVLVTGNYALTVRRLERVLAGRDLWLLVANSRGINVWCAAGGGHLTDHDVVAVVRSSGIAARVAHRELVLPQLAATGIERRRVTERIGWRCRWGPAHLEDLPEFLDRGGRVVARHRRVRFPAADRLEMASVWALPVAAVAAVGTWAVRGPGVAAVTGATVVTTIGAIFLLLPWLPVWGPRRWRTYAGALAGGFAMGSMLLVALGSGTAAGYAALAVACAAAMAVLSIDLTGTTPWYPGGVNTFGNRFHVELVGDRCTGAAECVQVCPCEVLAMDGPARTVRIARPDACIRCGACVVQCPEDALRFRFEDGRVIEPATVRTTRMNMLGRRTPVA